METESQVIYHYDQSNFLLAFLHIHNLKTLISISKLCEYIHTH